MMPSLADLTASELLQVFRRREAVPSEAIAAICERIKAIDPAIGGVVTVDWSRSRLRARESDERWRTGTARSLEGVPFGVKDHLHVAGLPTLDGQRVAAGVVSPAETSSVSVRRLEQAGAIPAAKLHIEKRHGGPDSADPPRNPWSLEHGVGGSSSGPAAAVAARELPVALGTDGLGSIRNPSSFAGLAGLKPTFGRIPLEGGSLLSVVGPLARSVEDVALFLQAMAGWHPTVSSGNVKVDDYELAKEHARDAPRIGIPTSHFFNECDGAVRAAVMAAVDVMVDAGCTVREVDFPYARLIALIGGQMLLVGRAAFPLEDDLAIVPAAGRLFTALDYERALRARALVQRDFADAFELVDVIVMPGTPAPAPRLADDLLIVDGEEYLYGALAWSMPHANVTGLPALSIPCGFGQHGLPLGLQLVGRAYDERTILKLGHLYQTLTGFHRRKPDLLGADGPLPARAPIDYSKWVPGGFYTRSTNRLRDGDTQQWVTRVREIAKGPAAQDEMFALIGATARPALAELAALTDGRLRDASILTAVQWLEDEGRRRVGSTV
jgi:aspartyl-tRNA(Asn)/glutamyl-tRNA(Gln) amidotransferase subunit A